MRPSLIDYIKARFHYELDTAHEEYARALARMEDGEFERGFVAGLERGLRIVVGSPGLWEREPDTDPDPDPGSDGSGDGDSEGGDSGGGSGEGDSGGGSGSGGGGSGDGGGTEGGGVMTQ